MNNSNINLKRLLSKYKISQDKNNKAKSKINKSNKNNTLLGLNTINNDNNDIYFNEIDKLSNSINNKNILSKNILNVNNIKVKTSIELISDDEKEKNDYNEDKYLTNNNGN